MPFPYTFPIIFDYNTSVIVVVDGEVPYLRKGGTTVDLRIEERGVAEFTIVDIAGTASYQKGQPVTIYDTTDTRIFGGVIDSVETSAMSPTGGLYHFVQCADNHYFADKRLVAESYLATAAGTIVSDIITNYLAAEGITEGNIEAGPDIVEAVFNYVRASDCFDALAEKAAKVWFIDENKALYFQARDITAAPWNATTDEMMKQTPLLLGGNPMYRNRQYIRGGKGTTLEQTETFVADGEQNAFTVSFPIAKVPTSIKIDGGAALTMGIKGLDAPGDFEAYWNKGDATITLTTPPAAAEEVEVKYYGMFDILVLVEDPAQIASQLAIEGSGTGYVDDISDEPKLIDQDASIDSARAKLAKFSVAGQRFFYQTTDTGLKPGQLQQIDYLTLGLNAVDMLIESVVVRGIGELVTYDITAIVGPEMGSWEQYFKSLADMKHEVIERLNVGTEQILIILVEKAEVWGWEEDYDVEVFTCDVIETGRVGTAIVC